MNTVSSISQFHQLLSIPEPAHPMVSIFKVEDMKFQPNPIWDRFYTDFYTIGLKKGIKGKVKYGQKYYDYDKGIMSFTTPRQVQSIDMTEVQNMLEQCGTGYVLIFHPDFLGDHPLTHRIQKYGFFSYEVNEALHLSAKEEDNIVDIYHKIDAEYQHIDHHTQDIIIAQIELLLTYCNRFYERQFITRKVANNDTLTKIEHLLNSYFDSDKSLHKGLPTVEFLATELNISTHYLSDMLRSVTGRNTQQHIHDKLIEKAKEYLTVSNLSIAEIAYQLGFEHPQSFNKLFKKKTQKTPKAYRESFI